MRARSIYNLIPFSIMVGAGVFLLGLLLMSLWRIWVIPDLFLAESLSWSETIKLSLALAALAGILTSRNDRGSQQASL